MFPHNLFNGLSDKRTRDVNACLTGYNFALELFDKYVRLPSAPNTHYRPDTIYAGLMSLSVNGGYAQSTLEDLEMRYGLDSPCGGAFLYRLRKLSYDDWNSRLTQVNDAVLSIASKLGLLDRPVTCAIDYTKVPYYGAFNRYVVRGKHQDGTNQFYEYATISIVQDGLRLCIYSRPVTLLDVKVDVVRELVEQAGKRGVKIELLLVDRAFFATACLNLLRGMAIDFITPCVCSARIQGAVDSLGKEGVLPFSIHENDPKGEAQFTMVVCWSKKSEKLIPFATNVKGNARELVRTIPKEYRRRWGIETSFRKVKEVHGRTLSPSPAIRLAYFVTSMILYNLWQAINLMLRSEDRSTRDEKEKGYRVTMPFMVTIFYAHLNGRI
jgi:Transposase DDE domain